MKHKRPWLFLFAILGLFIPNSGQAKDLSVVSSIRPVHSLVSGIVGDIAQSHLLVSGGESPHTYALKTSDARLLQSADIIVWVDEGLESFLDKAISSLNPDAKIVTLSEVPNLILLPVREGGVWEGHEHDHENHDGEKHDDHGHEDHSDDDHAEEKGHDEEHHDEDAHAESHEAHDDEAHHDESKEHNETDMHVWLDPQNAVAMVEAITLALSEADPDNAAIYRRNADLMIERLQDLTKRMSEQLTGLEQRRFIQFHDAFQYLENRFSLNAAGSITLNPERQVGAGRVQAIRERIVDEQVVCIFTEPQFEPKLVRVITEGFNINVASLDPIGLDIPPGPDLYFSLMIRNSDALKSCLVE